MPAEQTVETGEIVREVMFARKDGGSESAPGSPGRFHERMGGAQRGVLRASALLPMLSGGEAYELRHSHFCYSFCLAPIHGPGASRVCSTLLWYTAGVSLAPGAHDGPAAFFACPRRRWMLYWPCG